MNKKQKAISELIIDCLDNIQRNNVGEIINWITRNLIAKFSLANDYYLITDFTKKQLESINLDYSNRRNKKKINNYTFEHPIPAKVVLTELLKVKTYEERMKILNFADCVVILSKDEDKKLLSVKLRSSMPKNWSYFDNIFARYDQVGISVLESKVLMHGAIKR